MIYLDDQKKKLINLGRNKLNKIYKNKIAR